MYDIGGRWATAAQLLLLSGALLGAQPDANAVQVSATFDDPQGLYTAYYDDLEDGLAGAAATWGEYLVIHPNAVIDIEFAFADIPTATGGWVGSDSLDTQNGLGVFEPHVASELKDGIEERPGQPDGRITIGLDYLTDDFWYDPDPIGRTATVPSGKVDAVSTLTHELGHVFGMAGWHRGLSSDQFASPFDLLVSGTGSESQLFFEGPVSTNAYGGPVPLTLGNSFHVGNAEGLPGDDLLHALMNGVRGRRGARRWPSRTDFAVMEDLGYETTLASFVEGDANGDGVVNAVDYTLWREDEGATGVAIAGDLTLDWAVDEDDYDFWRGRYGRSSLGAAAAAIPEPATLGLLAAGFTIALAVRSQP